MLVLLFDVSRSPRASHGELSVASCIERECHTLAFAGGSGVSDGASIGPKSALPDEGIFNKSEKGVCEMVILWFVPDCPVFSNLGGNL